MTEFDYKATVRACRKKKTSLPLKAGVIGKRQFDDSWASTHASEGYFKKALKAEFKQCDAKTLA